MDTKSTYIQYRVWLSQSAINNFSFEWNSVVSDLFELGVIDGWVTTRAEMPVYAYLVWHDLESWQSFQKYCSDPTLSNPILSIVERLGRDAVLGYLEPEIVDEQFRSVNFERAKASLVVSGQ